jgi:hypothetical protein
VKFLISLAIAASLAGCSSVPTPTKEVAASIRAGLSREDHLRVATFYEHKAFAYDDEAAQHERLARSCIGRSEGAPASLSFLSRRLRDQMQETARLARTLANEHRRASGTLHK